LGLVACALRLQLLEAALLDSWVCEGALRILLAVDIWVLHILQSCLLRILLSKASLLRLDNVAKLVETLRLLPEPRRLRLKLLPKASLLRLHLLLNELGLTELLLLRSLLVQIIEALTWRRDLRLEMVLLWLIACQLRLQWRRTKVAVLLGLWR